MAPIPTDSGESGTPTPSAAYITLHSTMLAFYAARGMWLDGRPRGALASMLGERTPWKSPGKSVTFWVTPEQLDALRNDLATSNAHAALTGQQIGQFLRRLREAAGRAGLPLVATKAMGEPAPARTATRTPFSPLVAPVRERERIAFNKHVFDCLRDLVDFAQTSAYGA